MLHRMPLPSSSPACLIVQTITASLLKEYESIPIEFSRSSHQDRASLSLNARNSLWVSIRCCHPFPEIEPTFTIDDPGESHEANALLSLRTANVLTSITESEAMVPGTPATLIREPANVKSYEETRSAIKVSTSFGLLKSHVQWSREFNSLERSFLSIDTTCCPADSSRLQRASPIPEQAPVTKIGLIDCIDQI